MAFPFVFESNFDASSTTGDGWDSETDTAAQLDSAHYSELSRFPWSGAAPFRGAYCLRAVLSGGTADAFVLEGDLDIAAAARRFVRFYIFFSSDFDATADDTVNVFELQSAGPVIEATFGFRYVAATDVINFGIGEVAPTSWGTEAIERNKWYCVELDITLDDGVSNDGTIDLYVTPAEAVVASTVVHAAQVASLDQAAVTQGVIGVQGHLATTTGTILIDALVMDDARVYPITDRFSQEILMTKSGHAFVGEGEIENVSLMSGAATDNVLTVYDTDTADTNDATNIKMELKNTANSELVDPAGVPVRVIRGAYISMSGTNPRALIKIRKAKAYGSPSAIRNQGRRG